MASIAAARNIEQIINLDIRKWPGKKQRLTTAIDTYMQGYVDNMDVETMLLPNHLVMSAKQYQMLRLVRNMGTTKEEKKLPPEHRMWFTNHNLMEVRIK